LIHLAGHQLNAFPNLAFFAKLKMADKFILVDHVQYERHDWQNRNRLRNKQGDFFITIPIKKSGRDTPLNQIMINNSTEWKEKIWKTLEINYGKSKYFGFYQNKLKKFFVKEHNYLVDFNLEIIKFIMEELCITKKLELSSFYGFKKKSNELIIEMTKEMKCDGYISGMGAKSYVDENKFKEQKLSHLFLDYKEQVYEQMWKPFIPGLSALDALFNLGPKARELI